jgi:hypothetical protein
MAYIGNAKTATSCKNFLWGAHYPHPAGQIWPLYSRVINSLSLFYIFILQGNKKPLESVRGFYSDEF